MMGTIYHRRIMINIRTAAAAKSLQSCPTLRDPINGSPPGSPVPGIVQARTLEWVAISFPNAWKRKVKVKSLSRVRLFTTPWTAAYQAPLSMGFSRQEYWSGLPFPPPMHESEKSKWSHSVVSDSSDPMDCMGFSMQEYWSGVPLPSPFDYIDLAKWCLCFLILSRFNTVISVLPRSKHFYFLGLQNHCGWWLQPQN